MSINIVVVSGNLTREAELQQTASGTALLKFGIAVNDRVKNSGTGEWEDKPNFFNVTVWGNRAEALARFLTKGMKVTVKGRLHWSEWQNQQGEKRTGVDIVADDVELPPRSSNGNGGSPAPTPSPELDEEIPF